MPLADPITLQCSALTPGQSHLAAAAIGAALPEAPSAGPVRLHGRNVSQSLRM